MLFNNIVTSAVSKRLPTQKNHFDVAFRAYALAQKIFAFSALVGARPRPERIGKSKLGAASNFHQTNFKKNELNLPSFQGSEYLPGFPPGFDVYDWQVLTLRLLVCPDISFLRLHHFHY